jgi:hypothetical protein
MDIDELDKFGEFPLDSEVDELISTYSNNIELLTSHVYSNLVLMKKVWDKLAPNLNTVESSIYQYLTKLTYNVANNSVNLEYVYKFWNLPGVITNKLLSLISPKSESILSKVKSYEELDSNELSEVSNLLSKYSNRGSLVCGWIVNKVNDILDSRNYKSKLRESRNIKRKEVESRKYDLITNNYPQDELVKILLVLGGICGSKHIKITQGRKFELLLWLSSGYRITDITSDILRYVKVRDEVTVNIKSQFDISLSSKIDKLPEHMTLSNPELYDYYLNQCKELGVKSGRYVKEYPGYSLDTLKSTLHKGKPKESPKPLRKVSEYEVLQFIDSHLNSEFTATEIENYIPFFKFYGVTPMLIDEGEGYNGITFDQDKLPLLGQKLNKYDNTDLMEIRKKVAGIVDDKIRLSRLTKEEVLSLDSDIACDIISKLSSIREISIGELMTNPKILSIGGHIGVTFNKVSKDRYEIKFNGVSFTKVTQLITRSNSGFNTAKVVLSRLSKVNKFYKYVLDNFNEAIWNTHITQVNLWLES